MEQRLIDQIERDIVAARSQIVSSMRAGEDKLPAAQEAITRWVETVTDASTAEALAGQLIHLQAEQEKIDYPWSLHGYAVRVLISMILLPRPRGDASEAVNESFRQAMLALSAQVRDWIKRVPEARAEIEDRDQETASAPA